jgi:hypothetical protein
MTDKAEAGEFKVVPGGGWHVAWTDHDRSPVYWWLLYEDGRMLPIVQPGPGLRPALLDDEDCRLVSFEPPTGTTGGV